MKLLVLSASTGGGHNMRAYALQDWWCEKGGDCQVYQPLENTFWGYKSGCQLYNFIQKKMPFLHYGYFNFLELASLHRNPGIILGSQKFIKKIKEFSPDIIVSVHAHLNHGYFKLSQTIDSKIIPYVVYCGELADGNGFSRHWVNPDIDLFASPYQEGCIAAEKRGMPSSKCLVAGPLLRKPFYIQDGSFDRLNILSKYGLQPNLPVYLLGTGANGVNHHPAIIKRLMKAQKKCQVIALCGSNDKTLLELRKIPPSDYLDVVALSQVGATEMVSLLRAVDLMIARPGAGLTTEAIVTGCPMIFDLTGGGMPQENNNLNFWKSKTGSILSFYSISKLINILQEKQPIPRVEIPLEESPNLFLDALIKLVE